MKRLFLVFVLFACLCSACDTATTTVSATATSTPLPVLLVDQEHMTTVGLVFEIPAGNGFVLDTSSYDFGGSTPMAVQVLVGQSSYQQNWDTNTSRQTVLASGLQPLYGSAPIQLFVPGQQLIVAIGTLTMQGSFRPLWVGVVDVK